MNTDLNRIQAAFLSSLGFTVANEMGLEKKASNEADMDLMTIFYASLEEEIEKQASSLTSK
mgnify:CR=1 FL=1